MVTDLDEGAVSVTNLAEELYAVLALDYAQRGRPFICLERDADSQGERFASVVITAGQGPAWRHVGVNTAHALPVGCFTNRGVVDAASNGSDLI